MSCFVSIADMPHSVGDYTVHLIINVTGGSTLASTLRLLFSSVAHTTLQSLWKSTALAMCNYAKVSFKQSLQNQG